MATIPDAWSEVAKISIAKDGGSDLVFEALTETVDIDIGDKDFEQIATLSGARLVKFTPQGEHTITLEAYPRQAGTTTTAAAASGTGFFDLMNTQDTTEAQQITNDRVRQKYRLAIMWTDSTSTTCYAHSALVSPTNVALRVVASCGYFTSVKPSFTDGMLKWTVKFKVPAFDSSGSGNLKVESIDGTSTATLTVLASYSGTTKW